MIDITTTIKTKIEQYKNIAIFFHELPDLDALGSSYGLRSFLKVKFPDKDVSIIGLDTLPNQFANNLFHFEHTPVSDDFIKESLGIILDTSNEARVWTQKHKLCKELIRIDHHPKTETIADYEWVDDTYSATAEMMAEFVFEWDPDSVLIPTCNCLYAGIITDTNRFLYPSVTTRTYNIAAKLIGKGCDREKVHNAVYLKDVDELLFRSYILKHAHFDEKLGYAWCKIPKDSFNHFGVELRMSMVHVLANIKRIKIWFTIYYDDVLKEWKGSIRSTKLPINQIAAKYHGGGHKLAAGMTFKSKSEMKQLVKDVAEYLQQEEVKEGD